MRYDEIADLAGQPVPWRYHWSMNLSLPRQVMLDRNLVFHEDWAEIGHEDVELGYRWAKAGYADHLQPGCTGWSITTRTSWLVAVGCRYPSAAVCATWRALIPEPGLHERYGVLTGEASLRGRLRMAARLALFNSVTAPPLERALLSRARRGPLSEWCYWKLMLRHTQHGYRNTPPRQPRPTPVRPAA